MPSLSIRPSVKIVKSIQFKGGTRLYSNRYYLSGSEPVDNTHWETLFDAIVNAEKATAGGVVTIVEALGYPAGTDVAAHTKSYSTTGTYSTAGTDRQAPGECAALVRWSTSARSLKNHPIYLFKYYHSIYYDNSLNQDTLSPTQKTALGTYANAWVTGFSDGTVTHHLTSPQGHDATGYTVGEYITHRDFPYTPSA